MLFLASAATAFIKSYTVLVDVTSMHRERIKGQRSKETYPSLVKGGKFEAAFKAGAICCECPLAASGRRDERPQGLGGGVLVRAGGKGRGHGHARVDLYAVKKRRRADELRRHGDDASWGGDCKSGWPGGCSGCPKCTTMVCGDSYHYGEILFPAPVLLLSWLV